MRHNVFAATTNETNFLQGDNGNRRWWIIPVKGNGHVSEWLDIYNVLFLNFGQKRTSIIGKE